MKTKWIASLILASAIAAPAFAQSRRIHRHSAATVAL